MKKHNFSAGPAILPQEVIEGAAKAVLELDNIGLSLIEISHRSNEFKTIMEEACYLSLKLLGLEGKGYKALFLQGGASLQFIMTAYNLLVMFTVLTFLLACLVLRLLFSIVFTFPRVPCHIFFFAYDAFAEKPNHDSF